MNVEAFRAEGAMPVFTPEQAPPAQSFSTIYAFGDSLSDAGNDYIASLGILPFSPPYSGGRFSNGAVWVQDVAHALGLGAVRPSLNGGHDFAYGGAEGGQEPLHDVTPIDLPSQLAQFLINEPHPLANALYTLSTGANDLLDAIPVYANNPTLALSDVQAAVNNEVLFLQGLAADGARNFLILNVPDLGKTPKEVHNAATASQLSSLYDTELNASLQALVAQDHLSIHLVDTYALIDQGVANPEKYGLENVTKPVWTGNYDNPFSGTLNAHGQAQNTYLFFDHLHPTAHGHELVAIAAQAALSNIV